MSKTIVVLGATGSQVIEKRIILLNTNKESQGGSVVNAFLNDPELKWNVRAITRDPTKDAAKILQAKGVEVVKGDIDDIGSLHHAFKGANVVFGMTDYPGIVKREVARVGGDFTKLGGDFHERIQAMETSSGKTLVDAVAAIANTSLERFIWSELAAVKEISEGKYSHAFHFDAKAAVSTYIRSAHPDLAKKTGYSQLPLFMNNWRVIPGSGPVKAEDGTFEFRLCVGADTISHHVDVISDTGKFVRALLKAPGGTVLLGVGSEITWREYAELWGKIVGKPARFKEVTVEEFVSSLPPRRGRNAADVLRFAAEFGFDGGVPNVLRPKDVGLEGQVTTLEEYFAKEDWSPLLA